MEKNSISTNGVGTIDIYMQNDEIESSSHTIYKN